MTKGAETRARIVARAAELFNTRGYAGTAIADVMEAVQLEKGGIYRHFASKDELALAAFDYAVELVRRRVSAATAGAAGPAEVLLGFIGVFRAYADDPPLEGGCPILNAATESDDTNPLLRARVQAVLQEWQALLAAAAARGVARRELAPQTDPQRLAVLIIATLEGAVMVSRLLRDPQPLVWAAEHLCDHIQALRV